MSEFEFEPVHRAGKSHNNADALSRLPTISCGTDDLSVAAALTRMPLVPNDELNYFYWWGHDPDSACIVCQS